MSDWYKEYDQITEPDARRSNEEYLKEVENELRRENKIPTFTLKGVLFNRFYIEFIAYFLILLFGVILNAAVYASPLDDITQIAISVIISVGVCIMLYLLGYMSAKRRQGILKYASAFYIMLIFGIITIIRTICAIFGWEAGIATIFIYANNLFIQSCQIIFSWLTKIITFDIGYICVILTVIMIALGVRKNVIKERKGEKNATTN